MALDPRIILGIRPLETVAEMGDKRRVRDIAEQEVELRRQDIALRGQALRDAAERRNQPAVEDPSKALDYQLKLGTAVAGQFQQALKDPSSWPAVRANIARLAGPQAVASLPEQWDENTAAFVGQQVAAWPQHEAEIKGQFVETVGDDGTTPVRKFVQPKVGDTFPMVPKAATAANTPNIGSFEDYLLQTYGPRPTPAQITEGRKVYNQSDDKAPTGGGASDGDTQAIADAIARGEQPPTLQGLYSRGAAVRAALAKKGYNLADAQTDWGATQAHMRTLNGSQQTRMRQAVDNAYHSMDVIEDLAKQWDGGRFPMLNKAKLSAAKAGALGPKAQQIATQLEAQISDVTSELGNVYMGGNSPTDHALGLAAKNLSADWTRDQLKSAIALARKNLEIRANSMKNVGVAGASEGNPYAPNQAVAPPPPAATPAKPTMNPFRKK